MMLELPQTRDYRVRFLPGAVEGAGPARCEEVGCTYNRDGWQTIADERTATGREVAAAVRKTGRRYREEHDPAGITRFVFDPGQQCFTRHYQARPVRLLVTNGRQFIREHTRLADMAEDYTEHTGRLADQAQKG